MPFVDIHLIDGLYDNKMHHGEIIKLDETKEEDESSSDDDVEYQPSYLQKTHMAPLYDTKTTSNPDGCSDILKKIIDKKTFELFEDKIKHMNFEVLKDVSRITSDEELKRFITKKSHNKDIYIRYYRFLNRVKNNSQNE